MLWWRHVQSHSAPVTKITIVPRTSGALGYTMQVDEGEHTLMSRKEDLKTRLPRSPAAVPLKH